MKSLKSSTKYSLSLLINYVPFALTFTALPPVLGSMLDQFGISGGREGMPGFMLYLGAVLAQVVLMASASLVRKYTMLLISAAALALSMAGVALSGSFTALLVFSALMGVGIGVWNSTANAFIVDINGKNSARFMGAMHACFGLGGLINPPFIYWMLRFISWRGAYLVIAGCMLLGSAQFAFFGRRLDGMVHLPSVREKRLTLAQIRQYAAQKSNVLMMACVLLFALLQSGVTLWQVRYVTNELNSPALGTLALSLYWIFCAASRLVTPYLPFRPAVKLAAGGIGAGIALAAGVLAGSAEAMCVSCAIVGLVSGQALPTALAAGAQERLGQTSLPVSMLSTTLYFAQMIMPVIMSTATSMFSFKLSMLLPAPVALAGAALAITLGREGKEHR